MHTYARCGRARGLRPLAGALPPPGVHWSKRRVLTLCFNLEVSESADWQVDTPDESKSSFCLFDYSQVDMQGTRYTPVNFGGKKQPGLTTLVRTNRRRNNRPNGESK